MERQDLPAEEASSPVVVMEEESEEMVGRMCKFKKISL